VKIKSEKLFLQFHICKAAYYYIYMTAVTIARGRDEKTISVININIKGEGKNEQK